MKKIESSACQVPAWPGRVPGRAPRRGFPMFNEHEKDRGFKAHKEKMPSYGPLVVGRTGAYAASGRALVYRLRTGAHRRRTTFFEP
jgi:hypothetical protein